jgi:hypothetical protein
MDEVESGFLALERVKVMTLLVAMVAVALGKLLRVRVLLSPGVLVKELKVELETVTEANSLGSSRVMVSW